MDDGLVQLNQNWKSTVSNVLILIVVDDGLVLTANKSINFKIGGLNPYCSGRWSRTLLLTSKYYLIWRVLILIVVDDGLVLHNSKRI